ncbi:DUF2218 domain-containing protein [Paracoccus liaowanqingii]|uniref:DUF2218 domain-containing protein n=1 Tax=Paracoccus liaowanqingii TaxID=2560053 RepID=A0A4P7HPS1_9RHOB|nr:DUF2218 domain-containing protein [Paracoccus liaowanqingii]QBX35733.1 DUF2218 domain-containing protein [Paracoccus liaowanqingii]
MRMTADFPTARGPALLGTMAKHFSHKIPVALDDGQAVLDFPMGAARIGLREDALHLALEAADDAALERLREVVERHLLRFAHREMPGALVWQPA